MDNSEFQLLTRTKNWGIQSRLNRFVGKKQICKLQERQERRLQPQRTVDMFVEERFVKVQRKVLF